MSDLSRWVARRRQVACWWILIAALIGSTACITSRQTPPRPPDRQSPNSTLQVDRLDEDSVIADLLAAHNAERARKRLAPLVLNADLTQAAHVQAADMAKRGKMAHRGSDGSSPFDRIRQAGYSFRSAGENVAYGFEGVGSVMVGWMHSPGHRRNILGQFTEMGGARAIAPDGVSYWCVTFGTPSSLAFDR